MHAFWGCVDSKADHLMSTITKYECEMPVAQHFVGSACPTISVPVTRKAFLLSQQIELDVSNVLLFHLPGPWRELHCCSSAASLFHTSTSCRSPGIIALLACCYTRPFRPFTS
jgi:hypothetical protein